MGKYKILQNTGQRDKKWIKYLLQKDDLTKSINQQRKKQDHS